MPLYEYRCRKCGHQFERIESFSAPTTHTCDVCQGIAERLISAPAIRFKGSGFYETDYVHKPTIADSSRAPASHEGEHSAPASTGGASSNKPASTATETSAPAPAPAAAKPDTASSSPAVAATK